MIEIGPYNFAVWLAGHDPNDIVGANALGRFPLNRFLGPNIAVYTTKYGTPINPTPVEVITLPLPAWAINFNKIMNRDELYVINARQALLILLESLNKE